MAIQLSAIGAAAASAGRAVPSAFHGARAIGKGLAFAGQLELRLQNADTGSAAAQLAALFQAGTPLAAITAHVAADLSQSLLKAAGNGGNASAQTTLQRGLAAALAPPGASPPGSGQQTAAALEERLTELVAHLTGGTNTAGQQSEFSGTVLDANPAKEIPAQQTKQPSANAADVSAIVQSLLTRAVSSIQSASPGPAAAAPPANGQSTPPANANALPAVPSDILTRMIARAANADASRSGEVASHAAPAALPSASASTASTANSVLYERLVAIIAEYSGGSGSGEGDSKGAPQDGQQSASGSGAQGSAPASFAAAAAVAPNAGTAQAAASAQSAAAYHAVDPQAVLEQIVSGITMRNAGSGSELRLRLQPEHLGDVSLKLTVEGNTISANVVAQNADVRDVLLANQQQLARSLAEAGLSLGKFSVDVSGGNAGFTQQQSQRQAELGRSITAGGSLLSNDDNDPADGRFGPPLVSGSGSLVFNYLA